jgi:hypothetical protein
MTDDEPVTSADQDQWCEILAGVRAQLAKMVELMPAMKPDEVSTFVSTVEAAMNAELNAKTRDAALEERQKTLERAAQFGW